MRARRGYFATSAGTCYVVVWICPLAPGTSVDVLVWEQQIRNQIGKLRRRQSIDQATSVKWLSDSAWA